MKNIEVAVTRLYKITVDENNDIVKEYGDLDDLIEELAAYDFESVLPVIASGAVKVKESYVEDIYWECVN